jgi:hypothetical protein
MPPPPRPKTETKKPDFGVSQVSAMTADQVRRHLREHYGWTDEQLKGKGKMELNELLLDGRTPPVDPEQINLPIVTVPPPPARRYKIGTEADYLAGGGLHKGDRCVVMFREGAKYVSDPMAEFIREDRDLFGIFIGLVFRLSSITGKVREVKVAWRDFIDAWKT